MQLLPSHVLSPPSHHAGSGIYLMLMVLSSGAQRTGHLAQGEKAVVGAGSLLSVTKQLGRGQTFCWNPMQSFM